MKMCKHLNGLFSMFGRVENCKVVSNGIVSKVGDNNFGNITGFSYECLDCGKKFRFSGRPRQKWLEKLYNQNGEIL